MCVCVCVCILYLTASEDLAVSSDDDLACDVDAVVGQVGVVLHASVVHIDQISLHR